MELISTGKKVTVDVGTINKRVVKRLVYRCIRANAPFEHNKNKLYIKVDSCWVNLDECEIIRWE